MLKKRALLKKQDKIIFDRIITDRVIQFIKDYQLIAIFNSFNSEILTSSIIDYCFKNNIRVCLPKIKGKKMYFVELFENSELYLNNFGIKECVNDIEVEEIELAITPLLAFNSLGYRVGYGGGYYDRYFALHSMIKVGIAYDFQYCQSFKYDDYDIRLDYIITNKEIKKFSK